MQKAKHTHHFISHKSNEKSQIAFQQERNRTKSEADGVNIKKEVKFGNV